MKKLIALAVVMAAIGAMGAIIVLRTLSRPRVAPAPFGPEVPLPAPADLAVEDVPDDPRLAEEEELPLSAADRDAVAAILDAAPSAEPAGPMRTESGVLLPEEVLAEERDDGLPAPLAAVAEPMGGLETDLPASEAPTGAALAPDEAPAYAEAPAPDATDEMPSHHLPPPVSDVLGEPVAVDAETVDVEPSHVPPHPVSEVTGEHPEAVLEAEESLAVPVTEAIAQTAERVRAGDDGDGHNDFLTSYFNELAETPVAPPALEAEEEPQPAAAEEPAAEEPAMAPELAGVSELPEVAEREPTVTTSAQRDAESFLDEGNVYFNVGQYGLAIERYGKALELAPDLTAAYYNRANARTRAGEYDGALGDYDRALELQAADADALNNRGMLHLYRANYDEALLDFNAALAIDAGDTTVMVNRGLAHLHRGDAASALVDFQEAASHDADDAAAHYGAGQAASALDNREEALRHVGRAIELDPSYAREAAADPRLQSLQGDPDFMRLLRESGSHAER